MSGWVIGPPSLDDMGVRMLLGTVGKKGFFISSSLSILYGSS